VEMARAAVLFQKACNLSHTVAAFLKSVVVCRDGGAGAHGACSWDTGPEGIVGQSRSTSPPSECRGTEDLTHRPYLRSIQIEGRTFILNVERRHESVPDSPPQRRKPVERPK
jgi:hypothetical protein